MKWSVPAQVACAIWARLWRTWLLPVASATPRHTGSPPLGACAGQPKPGPARPTHGNRVYAADAGGTPTCANDDDDSVWEGCSRCSGCIAQPMREPLGSLEQGNRLWLLVTWLAGLKPGLAECGPLGHATHHAMPRQVLLSQSLERAVHRNIGARSPKPLNFNKIVSNAAPFRRYGFTSFQAESACKCCAKGCKMDRYEGSLAWLEPLGGRSLSLASPSPPRPTRLPGALEGQRKRRRQF